MTRATFIYYGPWQVPIAVKHALCADGKRRYAKITSEADTLFSIPASVQVHGKTVSGYVTTVTDTPDSDGKHDYAFHAYWYGKNGHLLIAESERTRYEQWKQEQLTAQE